MTKIKQNFTDIFGCFLVCQFLHKINQIFIHNWIAIFEIIYYFQKILNYLFFNFFKLFFNNHNHNRSVQFELQISPPTFCELFERKVCRMVEEVWWWGRREFQRKDFVRVVCPPLPQLSSRRCTFYVRLDKPNHHHRPGVLDFRRSAASWSCLGLAAWAVSFFHGHTTDGKIPQPQLKLLSAETAKMNSRAAKWKKVGGCGTGR